MNPLHPPSTKRLHLVAWTVALAAALLGACSSGTGGGDGRETVTSHRPKGEAGQESADDDGDPGGEQKKPPPPGDVSVKVGIYTDFPAAIVEPSAPPDAPALFGAPTAGVAAGGPCLVEPEPGTLYPRNWLRPRFTWIGGGNLFELRLHAENQTKDLVVYTTASSWTMPKPLWDALREHSADVPMTVSVRGGVSSGGKLTDVSLGSSGPIGIAPVDAPGSIVFWSISTSDESLLKGFSVGEEGIADVLKPTQLPAYGSEGRQCMGCHTGSPDGEFVGVGWVTDDGFSIDFASIGKSTTPGPAPGFVSELAKTEMRRLTRTTSTFSKSHWGPGDRIMLTTFESELTWIDLEAQSPGAVTGTLARSGDPNGAALGPSWSHDGQSVVYMSGTATEDPFEEARPLDLYVLPYNGKAGATGGNAVARPVAGASNPGLTEYYPAYSPDDQWIAYNVVQGIESVYDNPNAEVFVVSSAGGQSIRLEANSPPACSGAVSPGTTNSWPKWSPEVGTSNGRRYYWIVFSSRRTSEQPKLFVAPMMVDANGEVWTYRALYLWNQEGIPDWDQWGNHTPAWESFSIPKAEPKGDPK